MEVLYSAGKKELATVFVAKTDCNRYVEFVESVQPPYPIEKKWVLIVSTLFGCPIKCKFCDCSAMYNGKLTKEQILKQIDYMVDKRFPNRIIPIEKFKIQFARMGEPALNNAVLEVLNELPFRYETPALIPSISTIAPKGKEQFLINLKKIKDRFYGPNFQLQFSIHTTNIEKRDWLIPCNKLSFSEIADYGKFYYCSGDKKITLNFALDNNFDIEPLILKKHFSPDLFLIKITPVNPTFSADEHKIQSFSEANDRIITLKNQLNDLGYSVIISIGELEENNIGSNCGMHLMNYLNSQKKLENSYTYKINSN